FFPTIVVAEIYHGSSILYSDSHIQYTTTMVDFSNHDCREELKAFDLKVTPARLTILQYMEKEHRPLDVSEILLYLQQSHKDIDQATVYRILDKFYKSTLVTRLEFQEGKFRYEIQHKNDHHHLICESCGKIEDISD